MKKEVSGKAGSRRKSAFAEEEEGYMFVEEGFRVRFGNGETIDFYADSAEAKDGWMRALADVVGKESTGGKSWTGIVLARDKQRAARRVSAAQNGQMRAPPPRNAPPTPAKMNLGQAQSAPPPVEKDPRHQARRHGNRADMQQTRSTIF
jgi:hypothetical protein